MDIGLPVYYIAAKYLILTNNPQDTAGTQYTSGFANVDSAFILSYAIIILNVDQVLTT